MLNAQPARTVQVLPRVSATLVLLVASLVPAALLAALTPDTWAAATRAGADAGSLLAALAVALAWLVVARLGVTAGAAVLAGLPGRVGQVGRRTASAWSPALARRLVRAALGVAVVSGPALSHAAAFADQGGYPILDRVITSPATPRRPAPQCGPGGGGLRRSPRGSRPDALRPRGRCRVPEAGRGGCPGRGGSGPARPAT